MSTDTKINWLRVRDLPEHEREAFNRHLAEHGHTVPTLQDVPESEQDGYYKADYDRWKAGLPVLD